jgi:hypothetical protein
MAVHGISFGIDTGRLRPLLPLDTKTRAFSDLVPGKPATYVYDTETAYYDQYAASYYAFTWKKAGWDCMRHYEILAAGALPYFTDLSDAPPGVMPGFPRDLVLQAMALPGVDGAAGTIDFAAFPKAEYERLRQAIRAVTTHQLTTTAVAQRVLRTVGVGGSPPPPRVLFLSGSVTPDYMRWVPLTFWMHQRCPTCTPASLQPTPTVCTAVGSATPVRWPTTRRCPGTLPRCSTPSVPTCLTW